MHGFNEASEARALKSIKESAKVLGPGIHGFILFHQMGVSLNGEYYPPISHPQNDDFLVGKHQWVVG